MAGDAQPLQAKVTIKSSAANQFRLEMQRLLWSGFTVKRTSTMSWFQLTDGAGAANSGEMVLNV